MKRRRIASVLVQLCLLLACAVAGVWLGPTLHSMTAAWFPEPDFHTADHAPLFRLTGKPVVLFGTSTCPYCRQARELLAREGMDYVEYVLDQSGEGERVLREVGVEVDGVPLLFIGERRIVGFREAVIRGALAEVQRTASAPER
jgi:glutaredoxin